MPVRGGPVTVRTPGTSANLGPGFDAFGLAVDVYDTCTAQLLDSGLQVDVTGEGAGDVPRDESHLVVVAARHAFAAMGVTPPGLRLTCHNELPHARGLGSSAAAIVAGIRLADALAARDCGATPLTDDDALALATELEGHPDNVAPCLFGGLTVSWTDDDGPHTARVQVHPDVAPVAFVPAQPVSTEVARGLLPAQVPHAVAAANAARAGLLVLGLSQDPSLLMAGTVDQLHQPYRGAAMPASMRLIEELRTQGVPAVVSGSGPTVMALARRGSDDLDVVAAQCPPGWTVRAVGIDVTGAEVLVDGSD